MRVFDGTRALPRANVVVRDGRIAAVGTDAVFPDGVASIDGRRETPLPGLIDAHSHGWGHAQADLLLVDGDPTTDITATRAIDRVWKNGYAVPRTPGP